MRDTNRIFPMMNKMAELWLATCPDWRFAQLMLNFFSWFGLDPFYLEDDQLLEQFEKFCNEIKGA